MKICSECEKSFGRAGNLERHIVNHIDTIQHTLVSTARCFLLKIVLCKRARSPTVESKPTHGKKSFGQAVFLKTHMISTLGRKCTNVQNVEIHLVENLHLLSHSGYKPHQCNECGKSFIKVGELKKHLCIYSLEKCTTAQNAITQVAITIILNGTKPNIQ